MNCMDESDCKQSTWHSTELAVVWRADQRLTDNAVVWWADQCLTDNASSTATLTAFQPVSSDDLVTAIHQLPDKSCCVDTLPVPQLKLVADLIAPFLAELFNRSMSSATVPEVFKSALITPLLKKPDLDSADPRSYRPISNLSVVSKLLERVISQQLRSHLSTSDLLPRLQSA